MGQVIQQIGGLVFLAGLVAIFAFICNLALKHSTPLKRAAIASISLASLLCLPGIIALLATDGPTWVVFTIPIVGVIMAAIFFPVAYLVTRRSPTETDLSEFD